MSDTKFHASEVSCSEEEDFFNILFVYLWFKPRLPKGRSFCTQEPLSEQVLYSAKATYQISSTGA